MRTFSIRTKSGAEGWEAIYRQMVLFDFAANIELGLRVRQREALDDG